MNNTDNLQEPNGSTSAIIRIAWRQSRAMSNSDEPADSSEPLKEGLACTNRLKSLPVIASINSSISEAYVNVKGCHSTIETIINHTEKRLSEGAEIVSPLATKIGESLEQSLKSLDGVVCDGLDYLEDKVPSVKLPPGEIYDNVKGYIRNISDGLKKHVKVGLDEVTKFIEGESDKTESPRRDRKSDD